MYIYIYTYIKKAAILCNGINWTINKYTTYIYIHIAAFINICRFLIQCC